MRRIEWVSERVIALLEGKGGGGDDLCGVFVLAFGQRLRMRRQGLRTRSSGRVFGLPFRGFESGVESG